jgi:hypothetical protein
MATNQFKRFANVALLRRFNFDLLHQFLLPFRDYLYDKYGFRWTDNFLMFPYQDLVSILSEPDEDTPEMLHNGLFFIDELSTPKGTDALFAKLRYEEHPIPDFLAREDLALYTWMVDHTIVQSVHTEQAEYQRRRFETFYGRKEAWPDLSKERIVALEDALNNWFDSLKKGRGVQVMVYMRSGGAVSFHLRHGEILKRDCALKNNGMTSRVVYRPERYDFASYIPSECKLEIHADSQREMKTYQKMFGLFLFGDENFFVGNDGTKRYTLDPIRERGRDALICSDVDGLEWTRLKELHTRIPGRTNYNEVFKSEHCLFDEWDKVGRRYQETAEFYRATFQIQVVGMSRARSLTVCLPNVTIFDRGSEIDRIFMQWLKNRKFAVR